MPGRAVKLAMLVLVAPLLRTQPHEPIVIQQPALDLQRPTSSLVEQPAGSEVLPPGQFQEAYRTITRREHDGVLLATLVTRTRDRARQRIDNRQSLRVPSLTVGGVQPPSDPHVDVSSLPGRTSGCSITKRYERRAFIAPDQRRHNGPAIRRG